MRRSPTDRLLRIPVRFTEGAWECEYGGTIPVKDGATGEIIVSTKSITDQAFLKTMRAKSAIRVLNEGATLLVYLATKEQATLSDAQRKHLIPFESMKDNIATEYIDNWNSGSLSLVVVRIGWPTGEQAKRFATKNGGLWLLTEGPKAIGLESTQILLPEGLSTEPVVSLNHTFTKLSEIYEPWRISHTGNVYQRFLYQEADGRFYPLDFLRNAAIAKKEQELAYRLWQTFIERTSIHTKKRGD